MCCAGMEFNRYRMFLEPTSLALVAYRVGDTLKAEYGIDPAPIYRELGIDPKGPSTAGERHPNRLIAAMFEKALAACGDPALGIKVGLSSEPQHFFVIGHVWLASANLVEAMQKLVRYETILNSGDTDLEFVGGRGQYILRESYPNPTDYHGKLRADAGIASVVKLCGRARGEPVCPTRLEVFAPHGTPTEIYRPLCNGTVELSNTHNAMYFRSSDLEAPLIGSIPDVVQSTSRIADRYLASLEDNTVAYDVRTQLVQMLPGGSSDLGEVAARLYRSASTLQRQLGAEGITYRSVLDETRRELAEAYLLGGEHSLAEIAFLLGFSEQGSFTRSFKRWTGMSPRQFQKAADRS